MKSNFKSINAAGVGGGGDGVEVVFNTVRIGREMVDTLCEAYFEEEAGWYAAIITDVSESDQKIDV